MRAVLLLGLLLCLGLQVLPTESAQARTWIVAPDGSGDFQRVTEAWAAAASGDSVQVQPGDYVEQEYVGNPFRIESKSITTYGVGTLARDVSMTLDALFLHCPLTVVENVSFHDSGTPVAIGYGQAEVRRCVFEDNKGPRFTGALDVAEVTGPAVIEDCEFIGNEADGPSSEGGAVNAIYSTAIIKRSVFMNNRCAGAGGAVVAASAQLEECLFVGNGTFDATGGAGALLIRHDLSSSALSNCTFWMNGGETAIAFYSNGTIAHCIIGPNSTGGDALLCLSQAQAHCCDTWTGQSSSSCERIASDPSNFHADPMFCDEAGGDFHLNTASPCLPGEHGGVECGQVGAFGAACGTTPTERVSWGRLKSMYR
jgi:hypothetical protein